MTKIGVLSDTHGFVDSKIVKFFANCDEIWHAGDFGNIQIADSLKKIKPLRGVHGNIDNTEVRISYNKHNHFRCEDLNIWLTHIGGYPGNYSRHVNPKIFQVKPDIFVCGHSHILKVIYDKTINCLHINPGAAGNSGLHTVKTAIRFCIDKKDIKDLEILEIKRNG